MGTWSPVLARAQKTRLTAFQFTRLCWLICLAGVGLPCAFAQQTASEPSDSYSVCVDPDWLPYEGVVGGEHIGISADYLAVLSDITGMEFSLYATDSWQASVIAVREGRCDILPMINKTPERSRYLDFTQHYFDAANVFVSRRDRPFLRGYEDVAGQRLGVVRGYQHDEYISEFYPGIQLVRLDSELQGMQQVLAGKLDLFVGSMLSVDGYIQSGGFNALRIAGLADPHDHLRMAVAKGRDALLARLNQGLLQIDTRHHTDIFSRWQQASQKSTLDLRYALMLFAFFLLVLGFVMWRDRYIVRFNRTLVAKNELLESLQSELMEKNKTLEFMSSHDQLTSLHNRHFMIRRCEEEILRMRRFDQAACLILLDIDHFKHINDSYGHTCGDAVLQAMTELMVDTVREIDVVSRWGGEEFLILCPHTRMRDANALAVRLSKTIAAFDFHHVGHLTCSFGIAEFASANTFVQWFDRADKALYEAKSAGRNRIFIAE